MAGKFYVGTSNVVIPGNKQSFPPEHRAGTRLQYYSVLFNSLEINSSFYKVPLPRTFSRWAAEVGDDFRFTVKLSKAITHQKKLPFSAQAIESFLASANHLGEKKGCLLVQFPASITDEYGAGVEKILKHLHKTNKRCWHLCVEFRHDSWYYPSVFRMLKQYKTTMVLHDMPKSRPPLTAQPNVVYVRLHGPTGKYRGTYADEALQEWAAHVVGWLRQGKDVYVYFNNTMGTAFHDAQRLKQLVAAPERKR